jgi:hypothetical protein
MERPMTTSYNGWPASTDPHAIGIVHLDLPGHPNAFPPGVKQGDVLTVLRYVALRLHTTVEAMGEGCWGYNYRQNRNANNLSCHASGTAIDYNAPRHPNGKSGTFTAAQVRQIRKILAEVGVVKWGGDFSSTKDEMHFEVHGDAAQVKAAAVRLRAATPAPKPAPTPVEDDDMGIIRTCTGSVTRYFTSGGVVTISDADVAVLRKYGTPVEAVATKAEYAQLVAIHERLMGK